MQYSLIIRSFIILFFLSTTLAVKAYEVVENSEGKKGVKSFDGKYILPCKYHSVRLLKSSNLMVVSENSLTHFLLNVKVPNEVICSVEHEDFDFDFANGECALIKVGKKYGFITRDGSYRFEPQFDNINHTNIWETSCTYLILVTKNGKKGIVDIMEGTFLLECEYENSEFDFEDGVCVVQKGKKYGVVNEKGQVVIPFDYSEIEKVLDSEFFVVKKKTKCGIINENNKFCIAPIYDKIDSYSIESGYFKVEKNGYEGVLCFKTGRSLVNCVFEEVDFNRNQKKKYIAVKRLNHYYLWDTVSKKLITDKRFETLEEIKEKEKMKLAIER